MKKILFGLIILSFMFLSIYKVDGIKNDFPLLNKIIIIDPGHGGLDSGGVVGNIYEKQINLSISKELAKILESNGATVILTRTGDYDLSKPNALYRKKSDFDNRILLINESNANMYLSIHLNMYTNSFYKGPQVFYSLQNPKNKILAEEIQKALNQFSSSNRKSKPIKNVYMYDKLLIPGVLIECGFMSNKIELNNLQNKQYQKNLVKAISDTIISNYQ
jgi:N-acetylmuramoyl-L-alanine amidase